MRKAIDVAAGLVFRAGKVLIAQRLLSSHLGGLWEFPGGKREPGETFEGCLERELWEELRIRVLVGRLYETITHSYPEKTVCLQFYTCSLMEGEPQPVGCAAVAWAGRQELKLYGFPPADNQLLARLKADAGLWSVTSGATC